jgi:hypothetical protein
LVTKTIGFVTVAITIVVTKKERKKEVVTKPFIFVTNLWLQNLNLHNHNVLPFDDKLRAFGLCMVGHIHRT